MNRALLTAAEVVQLALTPIFLLSGIAALLGVFAARLARVGDDVERLTAQSPTPDVAHRLRLLRWRLRLLKWAVVLAALAGGSTCAAALTLFVDAVRQDAAAGLLFSLFGSAVFLAIAALTVFASDVLLAGWETGQRLGAPSALRAPLFEGRLDAEAGEPVEGGGDHEVEPMMQEGDSPPSGAASDD